MEELDQDNQKNHKLSEKVKAMKKTFFLSVFLFTIIGLFLIGCVKTQSKAINQEIVQETMDVDTDVASAQTKTNQDEVSKEISTAKGVYDLDDVAKHNTPDDCWIAIEGKVYDVTGFISSHPGGEAILEGCGLDATELYRTRPMGSGTDHSANARQLLDDYELGTLIV